MFIILLLLIEALLMSTHYMWVYREEKYQYVLVENNSLIEIMHHLLYTACKVHGLASNMFYEQIIVW